MCTFIAQVISTHRYTKNSRDRKESYSDRCRTYSSMVIQVAEISRISYT